MIPRVDIDSVSVRYRSHPALREVSLSLSPGITGLIGANGAGKTTFLKVLGTVMNPTDGGVSWFGGMPLKDARPAIALMPQHFHAPSGFRVDTYLEYVAWLRGVPRRSCRERARTVLDDVNLSDRAKSPLKGLSGGMLRRVALAQALVAEPTLVLLDEPTTGLDPEQRWAMRNLIKSGARSDRITVLASHILEDILSLSNSVVVLRQGRVIAQLETEQLKRELTRVDEDIERAIIEVLAGRADV